MGSTSYMSPEQARGIAVDERSDIWSLGVVLYEMLTRQVPFNGETQSDVIAAIIERQPASVTSLAPNLPPQLEWIITKALKKNRDERYQTIREMRSDLRELKQGLETQAHLERSGVPVAQSMSTGGATQPPGTAPATHATSSAEYIVGELKRHKLGAALALGFFGLLLIGGVVGLYKLLTRHQVDAPVRAPKFTALTTGGRIADQLIDGEVTISPDGKYVTYVATDERGRQSLWLKQVSTNTQVQLVPPGPYNYNDAIFSPDEEFIYYVRNEGRSEATVYRVPVIGGSSVKVFENIVSSICVSPDGRRLAFVRIGSAAGQKLPSQQLMLANTDGSGEPSVLVSLKPPQHFALWPAPSWSPDGKMIAIAYAPQAGLIRHTLVGVSVVDGRITPLTSEKWSSVGRVIWMPDGKGLVFTAAPDLNSIGLQLWYLDYPEGKARRITNDLNGYGDFSLGVTADGSTIATLQTRATWNIWVIAPYEDESRAKQITNDGMVDGYYSLSWLPDGRLIYNSRAGEKPDLWVVNADGTNRTQLTNDAYREYYARASPDGRYIVFESERSGGLRLWRINADGSSPKQLTEGNDDLVRFDFSPDSQWVVFSSRSTGTRSFWKVSIQGGAAEHLSDELGFIPTVSPDGKLIATIRIKPQSGDQVSTELALLPFESGPKVKTIAWPQISGVGGAQWTPDGQALYCIRFVNNLNNIWRLSLDGSPPKQVTNFTSENLWNYALSPDGRRLAVSRGHKVNDIVLIREFR
jgi:Tol biopolymer transport system component